MNALSTAIERLQAIFIVIFIKLHAGNSIAIEIEIAIERPFVRQGVIKKITDDWQSQEKRGKK